MRASPQDGARRGRLAYEASSEKSANGRSSHDQSGHLHPLRSSLSPPSTLTATQKCTLPHLPHTQICAARVVAEACAPVQLLTLALHIIARGRTPHGTRQCSLLAPCAALRWLSAFRGRRASRTPVCLRARGRLTPALCACPVPLAAATRIHCVHLIA